MEKLSQPQAILTLGKKIVEDLENEQPLSTMDRWLAHYISEKMVMAEKEIDPVLKNELEKDCCDLILNLWERRFNKSGNFSPLFQLEETLEVLEAFVLGNPQIWRYQSEKPQGKFEEFADKLNDGAHRIMDALITLSILPDKFLEARSWHQQMPELLSAEEQKLVEHLNTMIERALSRNHLTFEELYERQINPPSENYVEKLKTEITDILKQLTDLCATLGIGGKDTAVSQTP
jgi:hypothetical protein